MKKYLICLSVLFICPQLMASPIWHLKKEVKEEVGRVAHALNSLVEEEQTSVTAADWEVKNIYLRVYGKVGFKLPALVNLDLIPQIEMVWHKKNP